MWPTLQEFETESTKCIGALGGGHHMGGSCIRAGRQIISNFKGRRTSRIRIWHNIQCQGLDQLRPCRVRVKPIISCRDQDTRHRHSANISTNKRLHGRIIP
ncbi:hypothetical protein CR513_37749, partial [Mucuna pruriens]